MLESPVGNRRAVLRLMGSAVAALAVLSILPGQSVAKPRGGLPGTLRLLASRETCRHARRHVQVQPCGRSAALAARAYLRAPEHAGAVAHFEHEVREDFVAGRVAVVRGWVVAETELALLSMVER